MTVEFRLLGGIEAYVDGRPVPLGHARQRLVLVALLVDVGRAVPVDTLVDRVWGYQAPQRARDALYSYLSRLRQALAASGAGAGIERKPEGYVIAVGAEDVDLHRFRALVARARAAESDGAAAALYGQALSLWGGRAFAAVDAPWVNTLRDAVERERFEAELDHNEVRLRLGGHGELLPSLAGSTEDHPLDERLAGQFMLALCRCGRSADALEHYQRFRRRLADELGIDPGGPLKRLHQRIVAGDDDLSAPSDGAGRPGHRTPTPCQLPAPPALFTARRSELDELSAALDTQADRGGTVVIAAVGGAGGVGKTCLALRWAHDHADRFPDGQLFVNLRGFDPEGEALAPSMVLRGFLDALGVQAKAIPAGFDAQAGLFRSLVAGRRMLMLLDNARDSAQVSPLLPGSPTCTVLVTSRRRLGGLATTHAARHLTLGLLEDREARHLLGRHLDAAVMAAEPDAVAALLRHCAGLPLALSIVAARAAAQPDFPLAVLAAELDEAATRLDALDAGDLTANLRVVFSSSYRALGPQQATAFGLLGLVPGPDIALAAAASLLGHGIPRTRKLLRDLQDVHLIQQPVPGRYRFHDLVRLYAAECGRDDVAEEEREAALRRLVGFYLHTAKRSSSLRETHPPIAIELDEPPPGCLPQPFADATAASEWREAEADCLLAAQQLAMARGWYSLAWQMAMACFAFAKYEGEVAVFEVGFAAAELLGSPRPRALARVTLGQVYSHVRHQEAVHHLDLALTQFEELGDIRGQAFTRLALGGEWLHRGDPKRALHHVECSLRLFQAVGDTVWEARKLNNVGWVHAMLGQYEEARAYCERAATALRRNGSRGGEAAALDSLGYIARQTGRYEEALEHYRRSIDLAREVGSVYDVAETMRGLGETFVLMGRHSEARRAWRESVQGFRAQQCGREAEELERALARLPAADAEPDPGPQR